jgi:hypothetical protein
MMNATQMKILTTTLIYNEMLWPAYKGMDNIQLFSLNSVTCMYINGFLIPVVFSVRCLWSMPADLPVQIGRNAKDEWKLASTTLGSFRVQVAGACQPIHLHSSQLMLVAAQY